MGCNRINALPDSLLIHILSYLPTKTSVRTSVLSTRWKNLWLRVPGLDLGVDSPDEVFLDFIDNFLELNHNQRMQKLKIKYDEFNSYSCLYPEWISTFVDRGIQHLDVECLENGDHISEIMPQNIYRSTTLVSLKLVKVGIEIPESVVSLPCLKILHLEDNCDDDDDNLSMGKLISGCPVLEDLTLISNSDREVSLVLCVRSETLKCFRFWFENSSSEPGSVEIDAPGLTYMTFKDIQFNKILVKNLSSLLMIDIDTNFSVECVNTSDPADLTIIDAIRDFLTGISNVRHMIISRHTLQVLYLYPNVGPIPKFINLFRLEAVFSGSMLKFLPIFLESCPNLKHLILDFFVWTEPEQVELSYVPRCVLSTLERVDINKLIIDEETGIKLVNYFLENSAVLKKLYVSFIDSPVTNEELDAYKNLLTSTKLSRKCQLDFGH